MKQNKTDNKARDVSVLLSVYNGSKTLDRCLESVYRQSYKNYVVVVVNDASNDDSAAILKSWQAKFGKNNFLIVENEINIGLTRSLNKGLKECKTEYVARIDADDIWLPSKLNRQVNYLKQNKSVGVMGCWYVNKSGRRTRYFKLPITDKAIKRNIWRINPLGHSCVVIRRAVLERAGNYNEKIRYSQDRDLWFRLFEITDFYNLPAFLCERRTGGGVSGHRFRRQMWQSIKTRFYYTRKYRKSWYVYFYLMLPLLILLKPSFFNVSGKMNVSEDKKSNKNIEKSEHNMLFITQSTAGNWPCPAFEKHEKINRVNIVKTRPAKSLTIKIPLGDNLVYLRTGSIAAAAVAGKIWWSHQLMILEACNFNGCKINPLVSFLYRTAARRADVVIAADSASMKFCRRYGINENEILLSQETPEENVSRIINTLLP